MSSFYVVTIDGGKANVREDFLEALHLFTEAILDGAEGTELKWSS